MLKSDALSLYGTQQKLAAAIGRSQGTISSWPSVIPLEDAVLIELATKRKLKVDFTLYPRAQQIMERRK